MAFPQVGNTLSRLVWVVSFAFFHSQEGVWYLLTSKANSGRMVHLEKRGLNLNLQSCPRPLSACFTQCWDVS